MAVELVKERWSSAINTVTIGATKEEGGTGLGLSVCHSIVAEHDGRLRVKSKPGEGATFFVDLPCP